MTKRPLIADTRGFLARLVRDLTDCGWHLVQIPSDGVVPRNAMKLVLKQSNEETRLRVFVYKVTTSGRSRAHERRVEITTTYHSGLTRERGFRDVVLGFEVDRHVYVGIDSARLRMGGDTHNASSFFDLEGLSVGKEQLLVNPRTAIGPEFRAGIEYHAFFRGDRLADYLINQVGIHTGAYEPKSRFPRLRRHSMPRLHSASGDKFVLTHRGAMKVTRTGVTSRLVDAVERGDFSAVRRRQITPEQLARTLQVRDEIGVLGEQAVLMFERQRLRKLGHKEQSERVERVSLRSVGEGFDIASFEDDGVSPRYLEVKATSGVGMCVQLSLGEWKAAVRLGEQYYVVRVAHARTSPQLFFLRDPAGLERSGIVVRDAAGWTIDLRGAIESGRAVEVQL